MADAVALPSLEEVLANAVPFRVRLRTRFRGVTERTGLLLEGPAGWGEFAPFADYDSAGAAAWLAAGVEAAWLGWPIPVRQLVTVNGIVPDTTPDQAAEFARAAYASGVRTLKVKVATPGGRSVDDLMRVAAVLEAVGPDVRLRLDANGGWTPSQALAVLGAIGADGIEYVEQPCADLEDCAVVRAETTIRVAVDEGLRRAQDVEDGRLHDRIRLAADYVIVKSPPLGGVRRALRVAAALNLPIVASSAMDTSIGLAAGVALAAALPGQELAAGLGTGTLLATDLCTTTVLPVDGHLAPYVPTPDASKLAAARALLSAADDAALRSRLTTAWNAGAMRLLESVLA